MIEIDIKDLTKIYKNKVVVDGLNLKINQGSYLLY